MVRHVNLRHKIRRRAGHMTKLNSPKLVAPVIVLATSIFSAVLLPASAYAQEVMARGYYNHVESRISAFIPGVTIVDQVLLEEFTYGPTEDGNFIDSAYRASHTGEDGTRYRVTSVDFATPEVVTLGVRYGNDGTIIKSIMAHAATNYRELGEVTYDQGTVVEFIPAHQLHVTLPNGRILYVLFILHRDDEMDQRRLIIAEAETAPRARQPGLFLSSIGILNPEYFGTDADHTYWRVRYTRAGPPLHLGELVATQPWGMGVFEEEMSAGGEALPPQ
jgi:hypothetical protein